MLRSRVNVPPDVNLWMRVLPTMVIVPPVEVSQPGVTVISALFVTEVPPTVFVVVTTIVSPPTKFSVG